MEGACQSNLVATVTAVGGRSLPWFCGRKVHGTTANCREKKTLSIIKRKQLIQMRVELPCVSMRLINSCHPRLCEVRPAAFAKSDVQFRDFTFCLAHDSYALSAAKGSCGKGARPGETAYKLNIDRQLQKLTLLRWLLRWRPSAPASFLKRFSRQSRHDSKMDGY